MKIGRGNRSTRRKPTPAPLCPPQIPHDSSKLTTYVALEIFYLFASHNRNIWEHVFENFDITRSKVESIEDVHKKIRTQYCISPMTSRELYISVADHFSRNLEWSDKCQLSSDKSIGQRTSLKHWLPVCACGMKIAMLLTRCWAALRKKKKRSSDIDLVAFKMLVQSTEIVSCRGPLTPSSRLHLQKPVGAQLVKFTVF
jgi:hypothetical protein